VIVCLIVASASMTPVTQILAACALSAVIVTAAAFVYAVLAAIQRPTFPSTAGGWASVIAIALVSTVVAITTFFAGMERLGATDASTLSTLEPVITVTLAWAVLHESLSVTQMVGGLLIIVAVVVLARTPEVAALDAAVPEA